MSDNSIDAEGTRMYAGLARRAAALLHSIIMWKPLDMWNASFGWRAVVALVGVNGSRLMMSGKERMVVTDELLSGGLDDVDDLALRLAPFLATG